MPRLVCRILLVSRLIFTAFTTYAAEVQEEQKVQRLAEHYCYIPHEVKKDPDVIEIQPSKAAETDHGQTLSALQSQLKLQRNIVECEGQLAIPEIARGHEDIYCQFLKGRVNYEPISVPEGAKDRGRLEFPIASLANPMDGTFDLSSCGDLSHHLHISTGFRKVFNPANKSKVEIWFVPRFVIEKDPLAQAYAKDLQMMDELTGKQYLIFFNWGGWSNLAWYDVIGETSCNLLEMYWRISTAFRYDADFHEVLRTFNKEEEQDVYAPIWWSPDSPPYAQAKERAELKRAEEQSWERNRLRRIIKNLLNFSYSID